MGALGVVEVTTVGTVLVVGVTAGAVVVSVVVGAVGLEVADLEDVAVVGEVIAAGGVVVVFAVAVWVTVVLVVVVVTSVFVLAFDGPLKNVVGRPLPVMELPAIRSGTV